MLLIGESQPSTRLRPPVFSIDSDGVLALRRKSIVVHVQPNAPSGGVLPQGVSIGQTIPERLDLASQCGTRPANRPGESGDFLI